MPSPLEAYATSEPGRFDEANDWFLKRTILTEEQRKEIPAHARGRAFWLAGVAEVELIQQVRDSLDKAIAGGATFDQWKKEWGPKFAAHFGEKRPAWLETVWRNAMQSSLNAGRYAQMTSPLSMTLRPFWMYDAIMDGRTTPTCNALDGSVVEAADPWWDTHYPPLHHRCRSTVRSLRRTEALRKGITGPKSTDETHPVQEGWGHAPKPGKEPWVPPAKAPGNPDKPGVDSDLHKELQKKLPKVAAQLPPPKPVAPRTVVLSESELSRMYQRLPTAEIPARGNPVPRGYEVEASRVKQALKPEEHDAIRDYTGSAYDLMRDSLIMDADQWVRAHGGNRESYESSLRMAHLANEAIAREGGSKSMPTLVFRGIGPSDVDAARILEAGFLQSRQPTSFSMEPQVSMRFTSGEGAYGVLFVLRAKDGARLLPLESVSVFGSGEAEVLMGPGKCFRVLRRSRAFDNVRMRDVIIIEGEEIDPGELGDDVVRLEGN
jgi:SPP1 gp7 family putative phage head morphogenesis protein